MSSLREIFAGFVLHLLAVFETSDKFSMHDDDAAVEMVTIAHNVPEVDRRVFVYKVDTLSHVQLFVLPASQSILEPAKWLRQRGEHTQSLQLLVEMAVPDIIFYAECDKMGSTWTACNMIGRGSVHTDLDCEIGNIVSP